MLPDSAESHTPQTITHVLRRRAAAQPHRLAYSFYTDSATAADFTYSQLDQRVRAIAARLQQLGVAPGNRVLLLYPPGLEYVAAFFGCLYAGAVAVPVYPPRPNRSMARLAAIAVDAQPAAALTTRNVLAAAGKQLGQDALHRLNCIATDDVEDLEAERWIEPALSPAALAMIQYTSGSTAEPRGVMLSHANLLHNSRLIQDAFQYSAEDRGVIWLPAYHDMGLIGGILQPVYGGWPMLLMPPLAFLQRPIRWLQAISDTKATISGGPNFAYDLCLQAIRPEQREGLDLSRWTLAFCGAEPIRADVLDRFAEYFSVCGFRREVFLPCYGLAEATLLVSGAGRGRGARVCALDSESLQAHRAVPSSAEGARRLVSCGGVAGDQKVLVADPESHMPVGPAEVGEIWVTGESIAQGYWNQPQLSRDVFQARCADGRPGAFLRTGDLGFLEDGELFVTGRLKDLIIIRGRNYYPQDIEATMARCHPSLVPGAAAAFSVDGDGQEGLVVVQEVSRTGRKRDTAAVLKSMANAISEEHELPLHAAVLIQPNTIARTSSGKIRRHACKQAWLEGRLEIVDQWRAGAGAGEPDVDRAETAAAEGAGQTAESSVPTESRPRGEIASWLFSRLSEMTGIPPSAIDPREPFSHFGLDSLKLVRLSAELGDWLGRELSPTLLWTQPTIEALAGDLGNGAVRDLGNGAVRDLSNAAPAAQPAARGPRISSEPTAVVGVACRFPGAENAVQFWEVLRDGICTVGRMPIERWREAGGATAEPPHGGFLESVDRFDAAFFSVAPREAAMMDPQQRLLLEVAWEALENAAQAPEKLAATRSGVYIGISSSDYGRLQLQHGYAFDERSGTGNALSLAANRLSYVLGLRGPSMAVDTACSSSLVAVHLARRALCAGDCDLAIAGGVNLILSDDLTDVFQKAAMLSPHGRSKTFDASADGYVRAEGCGVVVLKRLSDAVRNGDRILAVIHGSAVNHDGASNGLTAPSPEAQRAVIEAALADARLGPDDVGYVEAHGTGTPLGDPIEVEALARAYRAQAGSREPLWIGSVKTNIGHAESAAGVAGLIKVILSLEHREIPPHLHFQTPNPVIRWDRIAVEVAAARREWPAIRGGRIGAVSSFGFGGTNAHVIVGQAPGPEAHSSGSNRPLEILALSAKTAPALRDLAGRWAGALANGPANGLANENDFADCAFSANTGRSHFPHRLALAASSPAEAAEKLRRFADGTPAAGIREDTAGYGAPPPVAFLFPGQGSQFAGMGRELYQTNPVFRGALEQCHQLLEPAMEVPLLAVLYGAEQARLEETEYTQVALFAVEYALAQMWKSFGIRPAILAGHSLGEFVAACVAGVFDVGDGLRLVRERGRLMRKLPAGAMAAAFEAESCVAGLLQPLADRVAVAALNAPAETVISGASDAIDEAIARLRAGSVKVRRLKTSLAFHSPQVEAVADEFRQVARSVQYARPSVDLVSTVTGRRDGAGMADPEYWVRQMRQPVRFLDAVRAMHEGGCRSYLECGPQAVLAGMGRRCIEEHGELWLPSLRPGRGAWEQVFESLGALYVRGARVDWGGVASGAPRRRIPMPAYPFQRRRYWFDEGRTPAKPSAAVPSAGHPLLGTRLSSPLAEVQFAADLELRKLPYVADHVIAGSALVPAAAFAEMAIAAGRQVWGGVVLQELVLENPLPLEPERSERIQFIFRPAADGQAEFEIHRREQPQGENEIWRRHARGTLRKSGGRARTVADLPPALQFETAAQRCAEIIEPDVFYSRLESCGIRYGPSFQALREIRRGPDCAFGAIELPSPDEAARYQLHPVLLDAAFQLFAAAVFDSSPGAICVPVLVEELATQAPPGSRVRACASVRRGKNGLPTAGAVALYDESGSLLVQVETVRLLPLARPEAKEPVRSQPPEFYRVEWQSAPLPPDAAQPPGAAGPWLILADDAGMGEALARELECGGETCTLVHAREMPHSGDPDAYRELLQGRRAVVHLWSFNSAEKLWSDAELLLREQEQICTEVVSLIQAMDAQAMDGQALWLVTPNLGTPSGPAPTGLAASPLCGLARTAGVEKPQLQCTRIGMDRGDLAAAETLRREILAATGDREVLWHGGVRYVPRLLPAAREHDSSASRQSSERLEVSTPGLLESLRMVPFVMGRPAAGEVTLRVRAAGLNFRDVMNGLGLYPGDTGPLGGECSGSIVETGSEVRGWSVGQDVVALATGCFADHVTVDARLLAAKPVALTFEQAAGIPIVFLTASLALQDFGRLQRGERVLIHAAAGGVGLAAVQMAQQLGLEIFATASQGKWQTLRDCGVRHIMDSRAPGFSSAIREATGGEGVHAVINCLSGDFIPESIDVLAPGGRFIEIGKRGIWTAEQVAARRSDVAYCPFDLAELARNAPDRIGRRLQEILQSFADGGLKPGRQTVYPMSDAAKAFRWMAQAKHTGKIVLSAAEQEDGAHPAVRSGGTYLITGGTGALGRQVARSLIERGARHLLLLSRNAAPDGAAVEGSASAQVVVRKCDVADRHELEKVLAETAREMPPLAGVVHAAGVLDDALLERQTRQRFGRVMTPKTAAWNLHLLTRSQHLDFFVLFSSVAPLLGSPGQANYAAANSFLDALAHYRRSLGLPAASIGWGPWAGEGMAARAASRNGRGDLHPIQPADAIRAFEALLEGSHEYTAVLTASWPRLLAAYPGDSAPSLLAGLGSRDTVPPPGADPAGLVERLVGTPAPQRRSLLMAHIADQVRTILGLDAQEAIDTEEPFPELGIDSLMAMELKSMLTATAGRKLSARVFFEAATIASLTDALLTELANVDGRFAATAVLDWPRRRGD